MDALQVKTNFLVVTMIQYADVVKVKVMTGGINMFKDFGSCFFVVNIPPMLCHTVIYLSSGFSYIARVAVSTSKLVDDSSSFTDRSWVLQMI